MIPRRYFANCLGVIALVNPPKVNPFQLGRSSGARRHLGGIIVFGASGLILGPATISVTLALIEILKERFNKRISQVG